MNFQQFLRHFFCGFLVLFILLCCQIYIYDLIDTQVPEEYSNGHHVVLWWTPFTGENGITKTCEGNKCFFTNDMKYYSHLNLKALIFYGSKLEKTHLPLPRNKIIWALFHEESPRNVPILSHEPILSLFNISSTFSRYSSVPLTLQYLTTFKELIGKTYYIPTAVKNKLLSHLAPIVYIQSDCETHTNRDSYVEELMKYIKIDSYGLCLNNKKLPTSLEDSTNSFRSREMFKFIAQYKFAIGFENAVCNDYITEKLWRPLISGTIPIYNGSPTVQDWLPNRKSAILTNNFDSPKSLAEYILKLNKNDTEYDSYLSHKLLRKVTNELLIQTQRKEEKSEDKLNWVKYINEFECLVCKLTYNKTFFNTLTRNHYDCSKPVSISNNKHNSSNWWHSDYDFSKCEALTLRRLINNNINNFTEKELNNLTIKNLLSHNCN